MLRSPTYQTSNVFSLDIGEVGEEAVQFKFVVDGCWLCADTYATCVDSNGNTNNCLGQDELEKDNKTAKKSAREDVAVQESSKQSTMRSSENPSSDSKPLSLPNRKQELEPKTSLAAASSTMTLTNEQPADGASGKKMNFGDKLKRFFSFGKTQRTSSPV